MWLSPTRLLPEDWPCTCFPLFVHSDEQHSKLVRAGAQPGECGRREPGVFGRQPNLVFPQGRDCYVFLREIQDGGLDLLYSYPI